MAVCLTRVPLIVRTPAGAAGHVSQEIVELFDLMPTCLELAGTRATHTHFARSLLPQLHGAPGDPERAAFTEGGYNTYESQAFEPIIEGLYGPKTHLQNERPDTITRCAAVHTPRFKYIERPNDQSELYDCRDDPRQEHNLYDGSSMRAVQAQLQTRLANWYINTTGVPPPQRDPRGAAVLDKPADLSQVAKPESLLDH
jgi:arylsulfatase A-like enzyme